MSDKSNQEYGYPGGQSSKSNRGCRQGCLCDNCCDKRAKERGNWYDSQHAKEMNQIMRRKK